MKKHILIIIIFVITLTKAFSQDDNKPYRIPSKGFMELKYPNVEHLVTSDGITYDKPEGSTYNKFKTVVQLGAKTFTIYLFDVEQKKFTKTIVVGSPIIKMVSQSIVPEITGRLVTDYKMVDAVNSASADITFLSEGEKLIGIIISYISDDIKIFMTYEK